MGKKFLGIDIGARAVKFVLLQRDSSSKINVIASAVERFEAPMDFDTQDLPALLSYLIKKFMRQHKLRGVRAAFSIAGQAAFVRLAKVPAVAPNKVQQIVQYETQQQVPFPLREVVWDYQILFQEENRLNILIAAVKQDFSDALLKVADDCGLAIEFIDVNSLALYNCLQYFYRNLKEALIVDIGAKATNIIIVSAGRFWTRSIPLGDEDIIENAARRLGLDSNATEQLLEQHRDILSHSGRDAEPDTDERKELDVIVRGVLTDIAGEIAKTINFFKSQERTEINFQQVLFTGGLTRWVQSVEFFGQSLSLPAQRIEFNNFLSFRSPPEQTMGFGLGPAIGLALRGLGYSKINVGLCSPQQKTVLRFRDKRSWLVAASILFFLLTAIWTIAASQAHNLQCAARKKIDTYIAGYEANKEVLSGLDQDISVYRRNATNLARVLSDRYAPFTVFELLTRTMPPTIWLTGLNIDVKQHTVLLTGACLQDVSAIAAFQEQLLKEPLIAEAQVETVGQQQQNELSFSLLVTMKALAQ